MNLVADVLGSGTEFSVTPHHAPCDGREWETYTGGTMFKMVFMSGRYSTVPLPPLDSTSCGDVRPSAAQSVDIHFRDYPVPVSDRSRSTAEGTSLHNPEKHES